VVTEKKKIYWVVEWLSGDVTLYDHEPPNVITGKVIGPLCVGQTQESKQPLDFFTNVDAWGAAEWFDRMAKAIREQDAAVLAKDDMAFETYRNIAASSAMRLVREYEPYVRAALAVTRPDRGGK
jgi:hypothetical protein